MERRSIVLSFRYVINIYFSYQYNLFIPRLVWFPLISTELFQLLTAFILGDLILKKYNLLGKMYPLVCKYFW